MRKIPVNQFYSNKQNKYDQTTNLGIDLESKINKQVVLPKITSKIADSELREFINRRKNQEETFIQSLRNQVEKLKRHVYQLDQKKLLSNHLKTEDNQPYHNYYNSQRYLPKISHHIQCPSCNFRTHQCSNFLRPQRNTENSNIVMKRDSSYRNKIDQENESMLQKSQVKIKSKQMNNSKAAINSNGSIVIEKEKPNLKKKRQSNKLARRRLRKCIWAVYFSIFLPSLARKIYLNRLKTFMLQYPHDIDKYYDDREQTIPKIKQDQAELWAQMQEKLDIMKAIQQARLSNIFKDTSQIKKIKARFQVMFYEDLNSSERQIHQPQTIQSQLFSSKSVEYLLVQFNQIFLKLIDNFSNFINTSDIFMLNWRSYSQGLLNNTFINNSHPKFQNKVIESGIVRLNLFKQTLQVYDQETEIILLTFDIFCRIYCFNWFLKLKDNEPKYSQQNILIANFFLTLLYIIGEMMIEDRLKDYLKQKASFEQLQRRRNKKIRFLVPLMIRKKSKIDLKEVNRLIYDPPLWNDISSIILQKRESLDQIKEQMMSAGAQVYAILKDKIQEDLKQVKTRTLQEKYIITNDKDRPEIKLNYENLNQVERVSQKLLNSHSKIKMSIKVNRKREGK